LPTDDREYEARKLSEARTSPQNNVTSNSSNNQINSNANQINST